MTNKITETDKAYIAGFVDADGSLTITWGKSRYTKKDGTKKIYRYLKAVCEISNCNEEILDWIGSKFPLLKKYKGKHVDKRSDKYRPQYRLYFNGGKEYLYEFLKEIAPYLKVKKRQANIIFKFIKSRRINNGKSNTHEELVMEKKIKWLNRTGHR